MRQEGGRTHHVGLVTRTDALLVERRNDAVATGLDKIANNLFLAASGSTHLVVEELDGGPRDALSGVLLLLLLERQLDEQLLQLLVAVINAELLETAQSAMAGAARPVGREDLEAIDVEDPDHRLELQSGWDDGDGRKNMMEGWGMEGGMGEQTDRFLVGSNAGVDAGVHPCEQPVVHRLP